MSARILQEMICKASDASGIPPQVITGRRRFRALCWPRWAIMKAARERGYSLEWIAHHLGRKDHTTVLNGLRRADQLQRVDPAFAELVQELRQ